MSKIIVIGSLLFLSTSIAFASQPGPYTGRQQRDIKALSAQEAQDYLDGKGAGLALAAELNHFPGPAHVLELAEKLELTPEQKTLTQKIFVVMQDGAKSTGKTLVEKERELDRLFANSAIDKATLRTRIDEIGQLQAEVRRIHLQAHLEQRAILTPKQVALYDELRGYGGGDVSVHRRHSH